MCAASMVRVSPGVSEHGALASGLLGCRGFIRGRQGWLIRTSSTRQPRRSKSEGEWLGESWQVDSRVVTGVVGGLR